MGLNKLTWRKQNVNIVAGIIKEVTFFDTTPNIIQIQNKNLLDTLYMSTYNANVSSSDYEISIVAESTRNYANPSNVVKIYLYCASDCVIEIGSGEATDISAVDLSQDQVAISISASTSNVLVTNPVSNPVFTKLSDGTDDLDINSDGSLNTKASLQAGTAIVGKVKVSDGTDELVVNADGSINVNFTGSLTASSVKITDGTHDANVNASGSVDVKVLEALPAGTNNIGDVDVLSLPALPAGTNNIGDVDVLSLPALPAGSNNIGDVDIVTIGSGEVLKPATTPVIYNVTLTTAGTEYSQALPSGCKNFTIGLRSKNSGVIWQLKFGASGTAFYMNGNETYTLDNILFASVTLYFQADTSGEICQIIANS